MVSETNKLAQFLIERASKEWSEHGQDFHLARVGPEFNRDTSEDYRAYLEDYQKLSDFARNVQGIVVKQDPRSLARIGVRPASADHESGAQKTVGGSSVNSLRSAPYSSEERTLIQFFRLLKELPEAELERVIIPMSSIAKLLKK